MTQTLNIKQNFSQYRIACDPAADKSKEGDPWYWIIVCKHGEIYLHGKETMAAMVKSSAVANQMKKWPELDITQEADDAVIFKFHIRDFEKVAKRMVARKRRRLSPEVRQKLIADGQKYRYKAGVQSAKVVQESPIGS